MPTWGPFGIGPEHVTIRDGRIVFLKPVTIVVPNSEPGIPFVDVHGALNIVDEENNEHQAFLADSNGDGKYDADSRKKDNDYSETSGQFHRRPGYYPGAAQRARMVEEATTTAFYTEIGKNYSKTTFADWIVCRYGDTVNHWFKADHTNGHFVFGGTDASVATSRITLATGDVEVADPARGVILRSPDGSRWRITVDDSGALSTASLE